LLEHGGSPHDLGLVWVLCQRTIILDRGQVVAEGPTSQILADVSLLAAHSLGPPVKDSFGGESPFRQHEAGDGCSEVSLKAR